MMASRSEYVANLNRYAINHMLACCIFLIASVTGQEYAVINTKSNGFDLELTPSTDSNDGVFRYMVVPPGADPTAQEVRGNLGLCGGTLPYSSSEKLTVSVDCDEIEPGTYDVWVAVDASEISQLVSPLQQVSIPEPSPEGHIYAYNPTQTGFTFAYDIDHPNANGKMYYFVQPEGGDTPSLDAIISCDTGCCGAFQQTDPAPMVTQNVPCDLIAGTNYKVWGVLDTNGFGADAAFVNDGIPLDLPIEATLKPSDVPTIPPSNSPSDSPTTSPSDTPTNEPSSSLPSLLPSSSPSSTNPSTHPLTTDPSMAPSTTEPSLLPSTSPSSTNPSTSPQTSSPTIEPSSSPTTSGPSQSPILPPSASPASGPSKKPSVSVSPSKAPTTTTTTTTTPGIIANLPRGALCGPSMFCAPTLQCRPGFDGIYRCSCGIPCSMRETFECEDHFLPNTCVLDPCCYWVGGPDPICESRQEIKCEDLPTYQMCNQMPCDCMWIMDEGVGTCEQLEELAPFQGMLAKPRESQLTDEQTTISSQKTAPSQVVQLKLKGEPAQWPSPRSYARPVICGLLFFALAACMTLQILPLVSGSHVEVRGTPFRSRIQTQDALLDYTIFDQ